MNDPPPCNFNRIISKPCSCFCHSLKMCMTFGRNPLFSQFELSPFLAQLLPKHIDPGYLVNATTPTILKLCRCFYQGVNICMTFCCNPKVNFCHIFHSCNMVNLGQLLPKLHWVSCERNFSYNYTCICF